MRISSSIFVLPVLIAFICLRQAAFAQETKPVEKGHYVDTANKYYQQADLPVYLFISTSAEGEKTRLPGQLDNEKAPTYKPMMLDGHGVHKLRHYDEHEKVGYDFLIHGDGMSPKSSAVFTTPNRHKSKGVQYYGKDLTIDISAKDEMSGVADLYQSVNKADYNQYGEQLAITNEGEYSLKHYATDNVGNMENPNEHNFTVDLTAPKTFYNVVGIAKGNIISISTKIYLTPTDSVSGVAETYFRFDSGVVQKYKGGLLPFKYLEDGNHTLSFYSIDNVNNKEEAFYFKFYLDKTAPIMSADVLGDKFIVGEKIYFSGRTKLKLTAVDNKSGIKRVMYSVDEGEFQEYDQPFYLPSKAGLHVIKYFAEDEMSNEGSGSTGANSKYDVYKHNVNRVYVDLTGPAMSSAFSGPTFKKGDTTFINGTTKINLKAIDPESGLQKITYAIDRITDEQDYSSPFTISESGFHQVNYFGYDNVNNRNVSDIKFIVDNDGPEIYAHYSILPSGKAGEVSVFPSYVTVFLAATDNLTGYKDIRYTINGGTEKIYSGLISNFKSDTIYEIVIYAIDKLGNKSERTLTFKTDKY